jgi:hypothetical protein
MEETVSTGYTERKELLMPFRSNYKLNDWGSITGREKEGIHFLRHRLQTSSMDHSVSYQIGTGGSYPGGKAAEA